jgi:hypothetical protein
VGYEPHITRADEWAGSHAAPISEGEWLAVAKSDDRIRLWAHSEFFGWRDGGPSMYWSHGQVNVKGARDPAEIAELVLFARGLGAHLQGDDGEIYGESGQPIE